MDLEIAANIKGSLILFNGNDQTWLYRLCDLEQALTNRFCVKVEKKLSM